MRLSLKSKIFVRSVLAAAFSVLLFFGSAGIAAALPPIPAGCPGNTTVGPSKVNCASIPLGCPGSTLIGPVAKTPTNCPYADPAAPTAPAASAAKNNNTVSFGDSAGKYFCGDGDQAVDTSVDIGCKGKGGGILNPITDAAFAIIRFLSIGVGLIIVGSLTFAGIQYTTSRGDPKATAAAIGRIRSNVIAFLIFIFSFAILNFVIPEGFFKI